MFYSGVFELPCGLMDCNGLRWEKLNWCVIFSGTHGSLYFYLKVYETDLCYILVIFIDAHKTQSNFSLAQRELSQKPVGTLILVLLYHNCEERFSITFFFTKFHLSE